MQVRLKEKGQITIPSAMRVKIDAEVGNLFEVTLDGGNLIFCPQQVSAKQTKKKINPKGVDIVKWIGSGKLFGTPEQVDAFIRAERDSWE